MTPTKTLRVLIEFAALILLPHLCLEYVRAAWLLRNSHARRRRDRILMEGRCGDVDEALVIARDELGRLHWLHPTRLYNQLITYVGRRRELAVELDHESPLRIAEWIRDARRGVLNDGPVASSRGDGS